MKSKLIQILIIFIGTVLIVSTGDAARRDRRQVKQGARIRQGVKSGKLTDAEKRSLRRGQKRIQKVEDAAESDGVVSAKEKAKIGAMQDHQSKKIYRLKHNDRIKKDNANTTAHDENFGGENQEDLPMSN